MILAWASQAAARFANYLKREWLTRAVRKHRNWALSINIMNRAGTPFWVRLCGSNLVCIQTKTHWGHI